jgi:predicted nucleotidyltransferase
VQTIITEQIEQIINLCRRYHVRRLDIFGSAAGRDFDPRRSDVDFLVEFDYAAVESPFETYFGLKDDLEALLGRPVDLVSPRSLENPYFAASVERSRQVLYAA